MHTPQVLTRFWAKVDRDGPVHPTLGTPCWLWTGARGADGYGNFGISAKHHVRAHRFSFELATGIVPPRELFVCHSCDVKNCVNPAHLWLGTNSENIRDAVSKGVQIGTPRQTHCRKGHAYEPDNFLIRKNGHNACKTCNREYQREYFHTHTKHKRLAARSGF